MTVEIKLTTIEDVKRFCNAAMRCKESVDVQHKNHRVDGASLMGILSLDLSQTVTVICDDESFRDEITEWIVAG